MDEKLNIKQKTNMAKKQLIKLTEGDLHKIITESVKKILKESFYDGDTYSKFREDPDLSSYRIFRPSEEWEDYNEDNFMHGQK